MVELRRRGTDWLCIAGVSLCLAGCAGGAERHDNDVVDKVVATGPAWWNTPGEVEGGLAAVGISPIFNDYMLRQARGSAEADGRARLAANLRAHIVSLTENWEKAVGDLTDENTFHVTLNDERLVREFVDEELRGAQVLEYRNDGTNVFALVVLRDPEVWTSNLADRWGERFLQNDALLKSDSQKSDFRRRLDELKSSESERIREQRKALEGNEPSAREGAVR